MLIRLEALELAANVGDSDASDRYGLNYLQARGDGSVVATDGTQLLRIQAKAEEPTLFDAELPEDERGFDGDVLIEAGEARDFKSACRKAMKRLRKTHEPVHVVIARDGDDLTMATADGIVTRRFVIHQPDAPQYPAVDRLLSDTSERREITLSVDLLIKMLRTLRRLHVKSVTLGLSDEASSSSVCTPLAHWTAEEVIGYLVATDQLPLHPVYQRTYMQPDANRLRDSTWLPNQASDAHGHRSWLAWHYPEHVESYDRAVQVFTGER
jgi:hypothetical protein